MSIEPKSVAYLLLRNHWDAVGDRYACVHEPGEGWPIQTFRARQRAEARADELERLERLKVDPPHYPNVGPQIDADSGATQHARLADEIDEPGIGRVVDGVEWWHSHKHHLAAAQVRATWDELGGGHFFEVVVVELEGEPAGAGAVHVVRRLAWIWDELGLHTNRGRDLHGPFEFGRPMRAFADPLAAEAFRTMVEREARVGRNPFSFASDGSDSIVGRASLEYPLLNDWLLDRGFPRVPKPLAGDDVWLRWWRRHVPHLSALEQAKAWEVFDRIRFCDVIEVQLDSDRAD